MAEKNNIRVRFAPSPTGEPHIGSLWTAQFNWLFARQKKGTFILRIEDTDQNRLVPGSVEKIIEALDWYGLTPDEGPKQGGDFGPYVQSERLELYRQHADMLVQERSAYYCFCTAERLEKLRTEQTASKQPPRYDKLCAAIAPADALQRVKAGEPAVIRLNVPNSGSIEFDDMIRGHVSFRLDQIDDSVLLKTDGFPTYHLANVVDDHLMEISHVIRAVEWLPSVPKHLLLYRALHWTPPQFAHLPLLLGQDKSKLSKRHGATSALSFRDQGYLPETMRNFLALMGWHPKGESEVLTTEEILEQFSLTGVNPSGAVFDQTKLDWLNGFYIRQLSQEELLTRLHPFWQVPAGETVTVEWKLRALSLVHERLKTLSEINDLINFVFQTTWNSEYQELTKELIQQRALPELAWAHSWLENQPEPWNAPDLKAAALAAIKDAKKKNGDVLSPLRQLLTLRKASPDVFDLAALLGKEESLRRIVTVLEFLGHKH